MQKKWFLLITVLIIVIFVGIGVLLSNVSHQYSGPPVLTVSEEVGDLGKIGPDEKQTYLFTLKNEGGEKLLIERVQAPCGCTATLLSEEEILPGKTGQLEVTFNPRGYEGMVTQSVYIYSNDPENQRKKIAIKADVEHVPAPEIQLSTYRWELGLLAKGESATRNIAISNQGDLGLDIESIEAPEHIYYDREMFELPKVLAPQENIEIEFTYDSSEQETGVVREYIRLVTSDPKRKNVTLRIEGYIKEKENLISIKSLQDVTLTEDDESRYEVRILLKNNSEDILRLVSVQSSVDYLEPVSREMTLSAGEEQEVVIRIDREKMIGPNIEEQIQDYIYLNIALPVNIDIANQ